jgi:hypothetical protein
MRLFGNKDGRDRDPTPSDPRAAAGLLGATLESAVTDGDGRIRVEDLLTAAAAVCGEACIVAAGEFDPEHHDFVPGSAVLSDRINEILCANASDWAVAGDSVFGIVHAGAVSHGYSDADFPPLPDVFRMYVSTLGRGDGDRWGYVGLSVPEENWPRVAPLRYAYELRAPIREVLRRLNVPQAAWPAACAHALAGELGRVREATDPGTALRIAFETTNGMAKMAPMTERHLLAAADPGA